MTCRILATCLPAVTFSMSSRVGRVRFGGWGALAAAGHRAVGLRAHARIRYKAVYTTARFLSAGVGPFPPNSEALLACIAVVIAGFSVEPTPAPTQLTCFGFGQ